MPTSVFISYRRGVADGTAGRIYDAICARLGEDRVFRDIDSIRPGDDFIDVLRATLAGCRAMVILIDPAWAVATDAAGRRRLNDPYDFVRLEVESAITNGIPMFPVLIDGAVMPHFGELPASMARLARRQAVELSHTRFKYDIGTLLDAIEGSLGHSRSAAPVSPGAEEAARRKGLRLTHQMSEDVAADVGAVWAVIDDVRNNVSLWPYCVRVKLTQPGPVGLGYSWEETHRVLGMRQKFSVTVVEYEPYRRMAVLYEQANGFSTVEVLTLLPGNGKTIIEHHKYTTAKFLDAALMSRETRKWLRNIARAAKGLG